MSNLRRQHLQDIIDLTHASFPLSAPLAEPPSTQKEDLDIPPLSFDHLNAKLHLSLNRHSIPYNISQTILHRAAEISAAYQASYRKACHRLTTITQASSNYSAIKDITDLRKTFEHSFEQKDLPRFLSRALEAKSHIEERNASVRRPASSFENLTTRRPFNFDFTPYLEAYFEQNAYPSHADVNTLALKGDMDRAKIVNWFQNRRNRLRSANREAEIKRLSSSEAVNTDIIEAKVKALADATNNDSASNAVTAESVASASVHLKLDDLATSWAEDIPKTFETTSPVPCVTDSEAFGLPGPSGSHLPRAVRLSLGADDLHEVFGGITIRAAAQPDPVAPKSRTSKTRLASPRAPTLTSKMKKIPLKAALRSCFSAAITLTCPRVHPALIRQKAHIRSAPSTSKSTIREQKRVPVHPYTLPPVLPTWEIPSSPEPERRHKRPTIASHAGKTRPGSPYPKQTMSRVSSTSSLASMASDDSQSSSRSTSSIFSASTVESSELDTPAQSPGTYNVELIDDVPFSDDIFGDYFFHSNPIPDNFFFDINVDQPFDNDVSLSFAEFDKSSSLSISEFDATTLPSFNFFES